MTELDFDEFDQVMDDSLTELSENLNMSEIGAAVNQLFHLLHFLAEVDRSSTLQMITAAKDHLSDTMSSDELGHVIMKLIGDMHDIDDIHSGNIILN